MRRVPRPFRMALETQRAEGNAEGRFAFSERSSKRTLADLGRNNLPRLDNIQAIAFKTNDVPLIV
jgi:hypothetical protein